MNPEFVPEDSSRHVETIAGYPVAISSYRLGATYYAKAEIDVVGAGGRIAAAEDPTREAAEAKVLAEARRLIEKKV
jgi:hypothetical protein